jgi:hypothetical protein
MLWNYVQNDGISSIEDIPQCFSSEDEYGPMTICSSFNGACAKVSMSK